MFVTEGRGINEIARFCGVSASSISERSRKEDWKGQKIAYESAVARRSYENIAAGVANERTEITKESILAARMTIRKYMNDLANNKISVGARDAKEMMQFLLTEIAPNEGLNHEQASMKNVTPGDAEFFQRIIDAARQKVAPTVTDTKTKVN